MDNIDVAILSKLNELAERHSLRPYDFVATIRFEEGADHVLNFEVGCAGNDLREQRFHKVLDDLGVIVGDEAALRGSPAQIIDALDHALAIAPRRRLF